MAGDRLTLAADGQTTAVGVRGPARVGISGGFGGGTASVEAKDPDGNWVTVAGTDSTVASDQVIDFPPDVATEIRVDITGSTTPTLVVWIQSIATH